MPQVSTDQYTSNQSTIDLSAPDTIVQVVDSVPQDLFLKGEVVVKDDCLFWSKFSLNTDSLLEINRTFLVKDSTSASVARPYGFAGEPIAMTMDRSLGVELIFMVCLLLTTSALSLGYRLYLQLFRGMLNLKQRAGYYYENTVVGLEFKVLLSIQVVLLEGLVVYEFLRTLVFKSDLPPNFLTGVFVFMGVMFVFHFFQIFVIGFLGSLFSNMRTLGSYIAENFTMMSFWGVVLFPLALVLVYLHVDALWMFWLIAVLLVFGRVFMISKAIKIFFAKKRGFLYIILYLCALEIAPLFVLFQAMLYLFLKLQ